MTLAEGPSETIRRRRGDGREVDLSVVVPTFNRCGRLRRVLDALEAQASVTASGDRFTFEVVVVSDGSTDGTHEFLRDHDTDLDLLAIVQPNAGPAAARNRGIDAASGRIIALIDDDVIPEPTCLQAHVERHLAVSDLVVIGPMLTPLDGDLSPWVAWEQHQLEKQYDAFLEHGRVHHRQFYTGNASLPRAALLEVGGFDTSLLRAEDVEVAHRLHAAGLAFDFEPSARAFHHAERSLDSWRNIAEAYGRNDVVFARRGMDEDCATLRHFFSERQLAIRLLAWLLAGRPAAARVVNRSAEGAGLAAARLGIGSLSRQLLSVSYNVRYYGGVADELGGRRAFRDMLRGRPQPSGFVPWLVLEQTLGHITHSKNLTSLVGRVDGVDPVFLPVSDTLDGPAARVPGWSNWTIRAGIRARRAVARARRDSATPRPDALFVHSQVPAILLGRWMRRIPTIVSLDATPLQYDALGEVYAHDVGTGPAERLKKWANERCYRRARHVVTWSQWAKDGLVSDYGVPEAKVTVVAPGVDVDLWARPAEAPKDPVLRVLFVGGDLRRKGGDLLLQAAAELRADPRVPDFEVHLCTPADVADQPGVVVHRGLTANSAGLIEQYHRADIFCLPTLGDCLPMVLAEAGAAGLPLVSTDVAAIPGVVRDGETGHLIEPGNKEQLVEALAHLLTDESARRRYGEAARALIEVEHDAAKNATRLIQLLRDASGRVVS
ncbi:MAG: glycosyltransferase [Ilumatobacter sp.]|uniref:glycosyltransferase n=1 Tax=Ilumatobacter sp. TaxID=1967498 RepID=UPI003C751BB1